MDGCVGCAADKPKPASNINMLAAFQTTVLKLVQGGFAMATRVLVAFLIVSFFFTISAGAQTSPAIARPVSLGERIVSWRNIP